jgi:NLP/P60 family protein
MAPVFDLADTLTAFKTPLRGTAAASAAGLALTAVVGGTATAAPTVHDAAVDTSNNTATVLPTTVSVPDIAWSASDEVSASAEAPAPVATTNTAASRDYTRSEIGTSSAALNPSGNDIVSIALSLTGIPYVYGGSTPAGFDCSGFTQYVYARAGISIPRTSGAQGAAGTFVSASEARPGDLVWHAYGHVGIYAGNGMVVEATTPGSVSKVQPLWGNYSFVRY